MKWTRLFLVLVLFALAMACNEAPKSEQPKVQDPATQAEPSVKPANQDPSAPVAKVDPKVAPEPVAVPAPEVPVVVDPVKALYPKSEAFVKADSPAVLAIPGDVVFFAALNKPGETLEKLGWSKVFAQSASWSMMAGAASIRATGHNLFKFDSYKDIGVDIQGPATMFAYYTKSFAFGFTVTISDATIFTNWLRTVAAMGGEAVTESKSGEWTLLDVDEGEVSVLLKQGLALFVFPEGRREERKADLDRLLAVKAEDSLGSRKAFFEALGRMEFGATVVGYVSGKAVSDAQRAREARRWEQYDEDRARAVRATSEGETAEETAARVESEKKADDERNTWAERSKARFQNEMKFFDETLGATTWVGAAELTETGVLVKGWTGFDGPSMMQQGVVASQGVPALFRMLVDHPLAVSHWKVDPVQLYKLLARMAELDGDSWDKVLAQVSEDLDVDAARLAASFAGEATLTLWGEADFTLPDADDMMAPLRGTVVLKLTDAAYVQEALKARLAKLPLVATWEEASKQWKLALAGHPFYLKVEGDSLIFTTSADLDLAKAPEVMPAAAAAEPVPAVFTLMGFQDISGTWIADVGPLFSLALANLFGFQNSPMNDVWLDDRLGGAEPKLKPEEEGQRAKFDAAMAQLKKSRTLISTESLRLAKEVQKTMSDATKGSGYVGLVLRPTPQGWEWYGGYWTPKEGVSAVVAKAVSGIVSAAEAYQKGMKEVWKQWEQVYTQLDILEPLVVKPKPVLPAGAYEDPKTAPVPAVDGDSAGEKVEVKPGGMVEGAAVEGKAAPAQEPKSK